MYWLVLFLAGLLEVVWAIALKYTDGFSRLWASVFTLTAMAGSVYLLAYALKGIPVSTGYAVWTGIGAVGVAIIGMGVLGEPRSALRVACIALILTGIIGLKLVSGAAEE